MEKKVVVLYVIGILVYIVTHFVYINTFFICLIFHSLVFFSLVIN